MSEGPEGPVAYTDGGCIGNPGPGGWGVHIEYLDGRVVELGGGDYATTNNRMELRAAIEAARALVGWPAATIRTDSQYVMLGITRWLPGWKRKGWKTSTGQPVLNRDLWEELESVVTPGLTWEWTRGHAGIPGNERCDEIASWFAGSVRPLEVAHHRSRPAKRTESTSARRTTPDVRVQAPERPTSYGGSPSRRAAPPGTSYISVVDGIPARHQTWAECEQRVRGVKGARYKKVRSPAEEQEAFGKWGITADDLFGI